MSIIRTNNMHNKVRLRINSAVILHWTKNDGLRNQIQKKVKQFYTNIMTYSTNPLELYNSNEKKK